MDADKKESVSAKNNETQNNPSVSTQLDEIHKAHEKKLREFKRNRIVHNLEFLQTQINLEFLQAQIHNIGASESKQIEQALATVHNILRIMNDKLNALENQNAY